MNNLLVVCIITALFQEATKMILVDQRASVEAVASMQKSVHLEAGSYSSSRSASELSFESTSASSMSAMMAGSVVSMSSSSHMMEMSTHSRMEASSSLGALTTGLRTGEMCFTSC